MRMGARGWGEELGRGTRDARQGGIGYRGGGHSPRTQPAAGSGAAARSSRGPGQPPHGPRRMRLPPLLTPAGRATPSPSVCLSVRQAGPARGRLGLLPMPLVGAAAVSSRERAPATAGARGAGPSPHPATPPRSGLEPSPTSSLPTFHSPTITCLIQVRDGDHPPDHNQGRGPSCWGPHRPLL